MSKDLLICKKSIFLEGYVEGIHLEKGKSYEIDYIICINWKYDPGKYKKHIDVSFNETHFTNISFRGSFINRKFNSNIRERNKLKSHIPNKYNWLYIWDYFYTKQEWRKIKLKRLQNEKGDL